MANFPEPASPNFDAIRQIETNDPVLGGAAEIAGTVNSPVNYALRALVARTQWLKQQISGISTPAASRSAAGIARLASLAQVTAGSNDDTIVTPYLLQQKVSSLAPPNASESVRGIARIASQADVDTGTEAEEFMTPLTFRQSEIIKGIAPAGELPVFKINSLSATPLNFTTDIIGNFGLFKVAVVLPQATRTQFIYIQTNKWMCLKGVGLTFYNDSVSYISHDQNASYRYNGTSMHWILDDILGSVSNRDILYIPMIKVR